MSSGTSSPWLFSARLDLGVFLGSAVLAFVTLGVGAAAGVLHEGTPDWAWVPAVLLVDVAHVWATGFRVYWNRAELLRRPALYALVPLLALVTGELLYARGEAVFWRALAYVAIFHFIRQQHGWVSLYRSRCGETSVWSRRLDGGAIYAATVYPLLYWHSHLPRRFDWFTPGDILRLPAWVEPVARPVYVALLCGYAVRSAFLWIVRREGNPGKDVVVATTAACWYVGIVLFDSDFAFTVTNVFIHGIPYFALVYVTSPRSSGAPASTAARVGRFLGVLWLLAFVEELCWDRSVWQERGWLFGGSWELGHWKAWVVPLLAVPQLTHYVLDGFVWRRRDNPDVARALAAREGSHRDYVPAAVEAPPVTVE